jgi:hypothetical protein
MFYCDKCRIQNNWPGIVAHSFGTCEECGTYRVRCYDIPSSVLRRPVMVVVDGVPITPDAEKKKKKETDVDEEFYTITLTVTRTSKDGTVSRTGSPAFREVTSLNTTLKDPSLLKAVARARAILDTARP